MSRQVKITGDLIFKDPAGFQDNVEGSPSNKRQIICDEFWYDSQANYTVTLGGTNDAIAALAGGGFGLSLLSGDTDNQVGYMGTGLIFDATKNPEIECRVNISDISATSFFFGFSDANTETTPASTIDYADATLAAAATDAAGFVSDADKGSSLFYAATIATGGSVAGVSAVIVPTDTSVHTLRVRLNSALTAFFYIDGALTNVVASAVTDVPLCAIFNFGTRANGGGDAVKLYRFKAWQDVD